MSKIISTVESVLDSTPFLIFFAVWTGVYLAQIVKKEQGAPGPVSELSWVGVAFLVAIFFV
jgi:hypothetical protein